MVPQDTKITPQNVKIELPGVPKSCFFIFSNACHTSHQMHVDRGPAAEGVALKIRRTPPGLQAVMGPQQDSQVLANS